MKFLRQFNKGEIWEVVGNCWTQGNIYQIVKVLGDRVDFKILNKKEKILLGVGWETKRFLIKNGRKLTKP